MDIYISKNCPHCKQLLILFSENKYLIPYFNIMDIETNPYPQSITSVPTLIKDDILYSGDKLNEVINDVNQYHMSKSGKGKGQGHQSDQGMDQGKGKGQGKGQDQGKGQGKGSGKGPGKGRDSKSEPVGDIVGICGSEACIYESLDDSDNNLNGDYCFLDDGYSEEKPTGKPDNMGKTDKFDNGAYEEMMKNRGSM